MMAAGCIPAFFVVLPLVIFQGAVARITCNNKEAPEGATITFVADFNEMVATHVVLTLRRNSYQKLGVCAWSLTDPSPMECQNLKEGFSSRGFENGQLKLAIVNATQGNSGIYTIQMTENGDRKFSQTKTCPLLIRDLCPAVSWSTSTDKAVLHFDFGHIVDGDPKYLITIILNPNSQAKYSQRAEIVCDGDDQTCQPIPHGFSTESLKNGHLNLTVRNATGYANFSVRTNVLGQKFMSSCSMHRTDGTTEFVNNPVSGGEPGQQKDSNNMVEIIVKIIIASIVFFITQ